MPEDDFVMEEVAFQALWIGVEDAEAMTTVADAAAADRRRPAARWRRDAHRSTIPPELVDPGDADGRVPGRVVLRPLVLADVQRVQRAAREDQRAHERR